MALRLRPLPGLRTPVAGTVVASCCLTHSSQSGHQLPLVSVAPATNSGDHHHGEAETAIYVKSGHPVFVFADGDEEIRLETGPGDYVFVPPFVPHREENPTDEPAVVIIARSSQEGIVVNLPSLWPGQDLS